MNIQPSALSESSPGIRHAGEIVVVDDDEFMRETLTLILSTEGLPVTCFPDGETFLKKADGRKPVCVFLDVVMPGRSGLQILKELSARRYEAPIFLISALNDPAVVVDGLKSGAQDFLRKPFDPYTAVQRVRDAVELWRSREEKKNASEFEMTEFPGKVRLTRRESEVLAEFIRGESRKDIAKSLAIGKRSVDNLITDLIKKLEAKNAVDLVRIAMSR